MKSNDTFTVDSVADVALIASTCKATQCIFTDCTCVAVVNCIEAFVYIWQIYKKINIIQGKMS